MYDNFFIAAVIILLLLVVLLVVFRTRYPVAYSNRVYPQQETNQQKINYQQNHEQPLITYRKVGGFGGYTDKYEIYNDGSVIYTPKDGQPVKYTIAQKRLNQIKQLLNSNDYSRFSNVDYSDSEMHVMDGYKYTIVIRPNTHIMFSDNDQKIPDEIIQLRDAVENTI